MAEKRRVYWDACIWFAVIKQEPGRFQRASHVLDLARRGEVEIWTSSLTLAEVFRKQCGDPGTQHAGLTEDEDKPFEDFIAQDFVVEVQIDHRIGVAARRLLRKHPRLKKPQDAIHLATAADGDIDEFHTFDGANLLPLDGEVFTRGGKALKICLPPEPPRDLFTQLAGSEEEGTGTAPQIAAAPGGSPAQPTPAATAPNQQAPVALAPVQSVASAVPAPHADGVTSSPQSVLKMQPLAEVQGDAALKERDSPPPAASEAADPTLAALVALALPRARTANDGVGPIALPSPEPASAQAEQVPKPGGTTGGTAGA